MKIQGWEEAGMRKAPDAQQAIHDVSPTAIYFPDDVLRLFRLRKSSIRREKRAGRLRVSKRCGRYYILGIWLLEWIAGGELPKSSSSASSAPASRSTAAGVHSCQSKEAQ